MILPVNEAKKLLHEINLDTTPFYSRSRGLKYLLYPVFPMQWNEMFVLFVGEERVGFAVAVNKTFEVYCSDTDTARKFVEDVPEVWGGYTCIGECEI